MEILKDKGYITLADSVTGELMHSGMEPFSQAESLYIEQTRFKKFNKDPLIIWDVGLGAGVNAITAIKNAGDKKLIIESFEITKEPLRLGKVIHKDNSIIDEILENGIYKCKGVTWRVLWGDFRDMVKEAQRPDVIFWDPFSIKTNPIMWEGGTLELLTRYGFHQNVILSTYSSSTRFRGALIGLGWFVGLGVPISERKETTVAGGKEAFKKFGISPLPISYLERFKVSHTPFPSDMTSISLQSILSSKMWLDT